MIDNVFMTRYGLVNLDTLEGLDLEECLTTLGNLERYNAHGEIPVSVLVHSYFCYLIACSLYPGRRDVQLACFSHDLPEAVTGDIPAYIKAYFNKASEGTFSLDLGYLEDSILQKFGLLDNHNKYHDEIKVVDAIALIHEGLLTFPTSTRGIWTAHLGEECLRRVEDSDWDGFDGYIYDLTHVSEIPQNFETTDEEIITVFLELKEEVNGKEA